MIGGVVDLASTAEVVEFFLLFCKLLAGLPRFKQQQR
jgi:hypothetical protein